MSRSQSISSLFRDIPGVREAVPHGRRSPVARRLTLKDAQRLVRLFAERNGWEDVPNIDKFDHLHEELIEMSRHLRYKDRLERLEFVNSNKDIFVDGIGDLLFALCRLANQLGVEVEDAFQKARRCIFEKYQAGAPETKPICRPPNQLSED